MDKIFNVLLLEDSSADVFLLRRHLSRLFPSLHLVDVSTRAHFEKQLISLKPDLVISDYRLPHYSGLEALLFTRANTPTVPFIFVTGAVQNEEVAQNTILKGAHGFVLKNNLEKINSLLTNLFNDQAKVTAR